MLMSSNVVIGRSAVDMVPPVGLAFWRWCLAGLIVLPFAWNGLRRYGPELWRCRYRVLLLGALGMGVCGASVYIGVQDTTATNAALIYAASPAMILALDALFFAEPVGLRRALGILLAILGVGVIIARGDWAALTAFQFYRGDFLILLAALSWAFYSLLLQRLRIAAPVVPTFVALCFAGALALLPFYVVESLTGRVVVFTPSALQTVGLVALAPSALAFLGYQKSVALLGPARTGLSMYFMPFWSAALAAIFLDESLALFHAAGLALVLAGVALAGVKKTARRL